jgi:hypothetical protein
VRTIGHELANEGNEAMERDEHNNSRNLFLGELMQETTLSDTHITDNNIFENVGVIVRALTCHGTVSNNLAIGRRSEEK